MTGMSGMDDMEEYCADSTKYVSTSHTNQAFLVLQDMREKGEHVDCHLLGEDGGVALPCHKLVLCSCSPYFRALFRNTDQVQAG